MIASSLLYLPLIGIPSAMLSYISKSNQHSDRKYYLSNSLFLFLVLLFLEIIILYILGINFFLILFFLQTAFEAFYTSFISSLGSVLKLNLYRTLIVLLQFISIKIYLTNISNESLFTLTLMLTMPSLLSILFLEFYNRQFFIIYKLKNDIIKEILKFAYIATIGSISYTFINSLNTIMLKNFYNVNFVSFYSSAEMICSIFLIIPLSLTTFFTNKLSKIESLKNKLHSLLQMILFYISICFILFILLVFYGKDVIMIVFGEKMLKSNEILIFMSISSILIGITLFISQFYFSILNPRIPALILSISSIIMFILSFLLVKKYNIIGASLSLMLTSFFSFLLYVFSLIFLNKKNKIEATFI
jgi:O-antigen/teichoic acid export membrane protein